MSGRGRTGNGLTPVEQSIVRSIVTLQTYTIAQMPTRGVALVNAIEFRGPTDTTDSLGTLGILVMPESVSAASSRLAASTVDEACVGGAPAVAGPYGSGIITEVYIGMVGRSGPYTVQDSGAVLAATPGMTRLIWDIAKAVRAVQVIPLDKANFAGAPGTGSARQVLVIGLSAP